MERRETYKGGTADCQGKQKSRLSDPQHQLDTRAAFNLSARMNLTSAFSPVTMWPGRSEPCNLRRARVTTTSWKVASAELAPNIADNSSWDSPGEALRECSLFCSTDT